MCLQSFSDISSLDALKEEYEKASPGVILPSFYDSLYNNADAAEDVRKKLNDFISEYNTLVDESPKKKEQYSKCLYDFIKKILPFMTTYGQMIAHANLCVLSDNDINEKIDNDEFSITLKGANKKILFPREYPCFNVDAYFYLGYLNFREQNFREAKQYLKRCIAELEKLANNSSDDRVAEFYADSIIFLSNCFEYKGDFRKALETLLDTSIEGVSSLLLREKDNIFAKILSKYSEGLENVVLDDVIEIIKICCQESSKSILEGFNPASKKVVDEKTKEYVHVLAHCLSEYAAELMKNNNFSENEDHSIYYILQTLARFFIDWITSTNDSYITCQATIRAENEAYPEALDILRKKIKEGFSTSEADEKEVEKRRAEISFYIFYFAEQSFRFSFDPNDLNSEQLLNDFTTSGDEFKEYADKNKDHNAHLHYWVVQFKFLLKNYAAQALRKDEKIDFTDVDKAYISLLNAKDSGKKAFKALIGECERLESLYRAFKQFRYLNRSGSAVDDNNF